MSVLSRGHRQDDVPKGVTVKNVDYDDLDSLKAALTGEDAVVSAIATSAVGPQQQKLADAAYAAGVKRFIPSEFGINSRKLQGLPIGKILAGKTKLVDDLQKKAEENNKFSWTGVSNGLFFDLVSASCKAYTGTLLWFIADIFSELGAGNLRFRLEGKESNHLRLWE